MQNYMGGEPELDIAKTIRRGLMGMGADSGASKVQPRMPQEKPPSAIDNLLNMAKPMSPKEASIAEHGKGGHIARSIGGFFLGDHEMFTKTPEAKEQYKKDMARYDTANAMKENMPAFREYDAMLRDNDKGNDAEAFYMMNKTFGVDKDLMNQMYGEHGNRNSTAVPSSLDDILRKSGMSRSDYENESPEVQRAIRHQYGTDAEREALDTVAGRRSPEEIQEDKAAELYGSAKGQQFGDDRKSILGIQGQVLAADQQLESLGQIRKNLADPNAEGLTGWPRVVRNFLNANNYTDGAMDAEMATGVVDLISQATFGALSQSELDLLKGGLMDPTKSMEYNLGTLDQATKRIENERDLALSNARGAADRYQKWKGQDDYDDIFKDDWLYQNVGAGSRIQSIPAFGGADEHTFQQYVEETMSSLSPFDKKPSRDQLVNGFAKERELAEEAYNAMIEERRLEEEAAKAAQERLQKPFGTKK